MLNSRRTFTCFIILVLNEQKKSIFAYTWYLCIALKMVSFLIYILKPGCCLSDKGHNKNRIVDFVSVLFYMYWNAYNHVMWNKNSIMSNEWALYVLIFLWNLFTKSKL